MSSFRLLQSLLFILLLIELPGHATATYNIGVGKSDITGPAAQVVMMGFASSDESSAGILNCLYARAFLIQDAITRKRVMFVHCDLHSVMQLVHQEVLAQLATKYKGLYTEQNVILHATHTHAGPGGTARYFLYDVSSFGYVSENFDKIVSGIVSAIDAAHNSIQSGTIRWNKGEVSKGVKNRSPEAYLANPSSERAQYSSDVDSTMRALHFFSSSGKLRGVLAFYPVHPTSLSVQNLLISGDNKGYAEFLLEDELDDVIVGIGITNAGDVSPNLIDIGDGTFSGEGKTTIESAEIMGKRQYDTLSSLIKGTSELVHGSIVANLSYVDFSNVALTGVTPNIADPYANRTCPAVIGQNFAAGTEDGRVLSMFTEGNLKANALFRTLGGVVKEAPQWVKDCQNVNKVPPVATSVADSSVPLDVGPTPLQINRNSLITLQTGVVMDSAPLLRSFSDVRTQPSSSYSVGSVASAVFAGAHPKNALTLVSSFCDVQKLGSNGAYTTVMTDAHWDLRYRWERYLIAESKNTSGTFAKVDALVWQARIASCTAGIRKTCLVHWRRMKVRLAPSS
ncbi:Neutral/alkaline non-lysosomal ceramidase C-terminal domain [Phytophthora infestans]|uniref:Neutral ceramidase n=1 Tax=Phytophthora infestans TaxID=4787 RepID=A0A833TE61_PHYIN|nr:Neutral/alkaline non-lysosomal ceramidase C-terminal domain [Phytophthora infestans]KAF4148048.1 Neutral/alkaline non-lysosomal ceramidase C-terminal domain-containing protein [Phytophthora infestans]